MQLNGAFLYQEMPIFKWDYLRNRGCRNPLAGGEAPAAEHEAGEVEPPEAGVG